MNTITVTYKKKSDLWGYEIIKDNIRVTSQGYRDKQVVSEAAKDNLKALKNNHKIVEIWE